MSEPKTGDRLIYLFFCLLAGFSFHVLVALKAPGLEGLLLRPAEYFLEYIQGKDRVAPFMVATVSSVFYGLVIWGISSVVFALKEKKKKDGQQVPPL